MSSHERIPVIQIQVDGTDVAGVVESNHRTERIRMLRPFPGLLATLPPEDGHSRRRSREDRARAGLALLYIKGRAYVRRRQHQRGASGDSARPSMAQLRDLRQKLQEEYYRRLEALNERRRSGRIREARRAQTIRKLRRRLITSIERVARAEQRAKLAGRDVELSASDERLLSEYFAERTPEHADSTEAE